MLGSDTAKRDIVLIFVGLLAALLFYGFYSVTHPLSVADSSLGEERANENSTEYLLSKGYSPTDESYSEFRVQTSMLDSLQKTGRLAELYQNNLNRQVYPAFYWHSKKELTVEDWIGRLVEETESSVIVEMKLSETGELLGFSNPTHLFPSRLIDPEILPEVIPETAPYLNELRNDTTVLKRFVYQFDDGDTAINDNNEQHFDYESGRSITVTRAEAIAFAEHHLSESGWPESHFEVCETDLISAHRIDVASVTFRGTTRDLDRSMDVTVEVLPTGSLLSMEYTDSAIQAEEFSYSEIRIGVIGLGILIFAIWVIILLFIRIRHRLIDLKLAVLFAVLAGFAFPGIFINEWLYEITNSFDEFGFRILFIQLFQTGISAAFISLGYFTVTSVSDSLTREYWSEKLQTFDILRMGHLYSRPIGWVVIRSVAYSFIIATVAALSLYAIPESYFSIDEQFRSNNSFFPFLNSLFYTFFIVLLTAQAVFLILVGKFSSYTKNIWAVSIFSAILFSVFSLLPYSIGPDLIELGIVGAIGFFLGWCYVKEDFLTVFLTLFFFGVHLSSAGGWVMEGSPDTSIFIVSALLLAAAIIFGVISIRKGKSIKELPKYIPDYIVELAQDERMKQELQIARKVQQSFLPDRTPNIAGLDIAAICTPAYETGGDYYDFIQLNDGRLAVTIGDVSGKGIEAAFYMTFTKGVLHALCTEHNSTLEILSRINYLFRSNAKKGTFISLIFGMIDIQNRQFTFSRAGHNPILHYSAKNEELKEFRPDGIGLGMASDELFKENTAELVLDFEKDDILVLFTDGVVEATNRLNKFYGDRRLHQIIKRNKNLTSEQILEKLNDDIRKFGDGAEQHDDMTVLVMKMK